VTLKPYKLNGKTLGFQLFTTDKKNPPTSAECGLYRFWNLCCGRLSGQITHF
jgi:hypothetical protein